MYRYRYTVWAYGMGYLYGVAGVCVVGLGKNNYSVSVRGVALQQAFCHRLPHSAFRTHPHDSLTHGESSLDEHGEQAETGFALPIVLNVPPPLVARRDRSGA